MPLETAGANVTADDAPVHAVYAYQPPIAFFAAGAPASGAGVFNIVDYGAVASASFDNRAIIQHVIQLAHDAGGGIVYVPAGVFGISAGADPSTGGVRLLENVLLKGDGIGASTLRVLDGQDHRAK